MRLRQGLLGHGHLVANCVCCPVMKKEKPTYDSTFLHTRHEALIIFAVWLLALIWVVPYCYFHGYGIDTANLKTVWGVPSWVFWGIVAPWLVANFFTFWFCFFSMADDDLGEEAE